MILTPIEVREALIRQWVIVATEAPKLDLVAASRIDGWSNIEVLAHLTAQPQLVLRYLATSSGEVPEMTLVSNLFGTRRMAVVVDQSARNAAKQGNIDLQGAVIDVVGKLRKAELSKTIQSAQGPISLSDFLATRLVEAVGPARDFHPAIRTDQLALEYVADLLGYLLSVREPNLAGQHVEFEVGEWTDMATGRIGCPDRLRAVLPLVR